MKYFSQDTINILIENRLNDSKAFYDEHKKQLDALVREPMHNLIENVTPTLQAFDPEILCNPKRQISRIRRDTRFTNDKSLYRDSMWCFLGRDKRVYENFPSFFFEIRPEYVWWGCGMYFADSAMLESYRKMILSRDPVFLTAKDAYENQGTFIFDMDDVYKRTKFKDEPEDFRLWLDRKSVYLAHKEDDVESAFSENLSEQVSADLRLLAPFYKFLVTAWERKITPERVF